MKKILFLIMLCCCVSTTNAHHISSFLGYTSIPDKHTHFVAHEAEKNANIALFVGVAAIALTSVMVLSASEYNQGQFRIARF